MRQQPYRRIDRFRLSSVNLRDLGYLIALAALRHFGRAAQACHVSQPTLSTQIRKLEEELGVALVERAPRQVMLTPVGRDIADRALRVLADVEQMRETARRTIDPEGGSIRLGIFPTLGPYLLPHVVPVLRARFPKLELLLVEEKTEQLLAMLRNGRLDAAVLALPSKHPLSNRRNLQLSDLADQHLLLLEDGHCLRDQALEVCTKAGAGEKDGFRATSLETLRQMVAAGVGITLLPMLAVKPPVSTSSDIQLVNFKTPAPTRRVAMVWRKSSAMGTFLHQFAAVLRELPAELLRAPANKRER